MSSSLEFWRIEEHYFHHVLVQFGVCECVCVSAYVHVFVCASNFLVSEIHAKNTVVVVLVLSYKNQQTNGSFRAQQTSDTTTETLIAYGNSTWHVSKCKVYKL